ncbi:glyoxalase family protein [Aspergillus brunneoviolaceus CBS 621.78]|uniref:Glyoxalase family protein n=1 Tax=Aspergillus brunneoviolaceus CBS 621.78 TaxID=1450534 RepID=A0ACD1GE19_9EURO|nr:glyoxalase family protein [Aspergillus brunneoviolaceus CBS 621.78]RAH47418.1 glyoxalase family protein [Aspergillus brunneoviolaceus CBS 621.78]
MTSSPTSRNAVDLLTSLAGIITTIATNLHANRLDRARLRATLKEYAARAESDAKLINASRQSQRCVEHGLLLAYVHMEFIATLLRYNLTVPATAVKWYSVRSLRKRHRLSLFGIPAQARDLRAQLENIQNKAELLYADFAESGVQIPETPILYRKVTACEPVGAPPEAIHDLLRRGTLAEQELSGKIPP